MLVKIRPAHRLGGATLLTSWLAGTLAAPELQTVVCILTLFLAQTGFRGLEFRLQAANGGVLPGPPEGGIQTRTGSRCAPNCAITENPIYFYAPTGYLDRLAQCEMEHVI